MHSKYSFNKYLLCAKTPRLYARLLFTGSSYSSGGNRYQTSKETDTADSSRCWERKKIKLMDREWLGRRRPNWERMPKDEEMAFKQDQNNKSLVVQTLFVLGRRNSKSKSSKVRALP